jgi:outer membrane translocation and assembly module TamA
MTTRPTGTGGSIVDMEVFEKPRWTVELGVGWDSDRGFEVRSGLRDDNLFGRGVGANLRLRWNDIEKVALLYGSLPPLPGGRISLGSTLSYSEEDREATVGDLVIPLTEKETLASLDLAYQVAPRTTLKPYVRISNTTTTSSFYETDLFVSTVGAAGLHDRFDNPFDPRSGYSLVGDVGWSTSYLGSDLDTLRAAASGSIAVEPFSGFTLVQTVRFGIAEALLGTDLDEAAKFQAGGQGSIRGFDRNSVGPIDPITGEASGGALFILNEELRIPLWDSLRAAVFADVGQVWESWSEANWRLSLGVGLGLRWSTPVGLVWADMAWPVANMESEGICFDADTGSFVPCTLGTSQGPKYYLGIGRPF